MLKHTFSALCIAFLASLFYLTYMALLASATGIHTSMGGIHGVTLFYFLVGLIYGISRDLVAAVKARRTKEAAK